MWIKTFYEHKEFLIKESLSIWYDSLLSSVNAEEVNIYNTLKLDNNSNVDLEYINHNDKFINTLSSIGLKKSDMELSSNYETFLTTPCRFMFISDIKANDLETPEYLLLQIYNNSLGKFETTKCYKIKDDINKFYNTLSSKIIEITDGNEKYVYETSDGSNNWTLKSLNDNDIYRKSFRKEDLERLIQQRKVKINVV